MNITESISDGLKREYKVTINAAELDEKLRQRLDELKGQVRLAGFRQGKVPLDHLKRVYGKSLMGEVVNQSVNDATGKLISERDLRPAQQPSVDLDKSIEKVIEGEGDLAFTVSFEIIPQFELGDFSEVEIRRLVAEVEEHEVDEALKRIAEQNRRFELCDDAAGHGDVVNIDFVGSVDGKEFEGGKAENMGVEIGAGRFIPGFEEQLKGARAGEERTLNVTFPDAYAEKSLAGKAAVFATTVRDVRRPAKTQIDEAFAKELGFDDLGKLRAAVREQIERDYKRLSRERLKRELLDALDERYDFELPGQLVNSELQQLLAQVRQEKNQHQDHDHHDHDHAHHDHDHAHHDHDHAHHDHDHAHHDHDHAHHDHDHAHHDHDHAHHDHDHAHHDHDHAHHDHDHAHADDMLSDEERAELAAIAERRVRLGLVLSEIGSRNNITVSQEELTRAMAEQARRFPGQEKMLYAYYQKNPQALVQLRGPIFEDKVVDFICELAKVRDEKVSREELIRNPDAEDEGEEGAPGRAALKGKKAASAKKTAAKQAPVKKDSAKKEQAKGR